jgi:hypothetical protein
VRELLCTLECELFDRRKFRTKAEARMAIFEFIEGWYNPSPPLGARLQIPHHIRKERAEQVTIRYWLTIHETGGTPTPYEDIRMTISYAPVFLAGLAGATDC